MDHHSHSHGSSRQGKMLWAVALTASILVLEAVGGVLSGSLALLADAGHMLTDLAALLISLAAMRMAERPASPTHTYGFARLEVLAALGNSITFFLMVAGVGWEAVRRFSNPTLPDWKTMAWIALAGILANGFCAWFLHGADQEDLNLQGAFLHVLGDLASSIGVLAGAWIIARTGFTWIDPVLSLGIALLIAVGAIQLFRKTLRILLESAPKGLTLDFITRELRGEIPEIMGIHHIHLWEVGSGEIHMTAHLVVENRVLSEAMPILERASAFSKEKLGITHSTFQVEAMIPVKLQGPQNL